MFVFDTPPSQTSPLVGVSNTPTPLRHKFPHVSQSVGDLESEAGSAASVLERGRLRGFGLGARRPAPGFFSDVTQFDLTDFAGQKRDLRTMEPVAGEIGHCFVVVSCVSPCRAGAALPGRFAETLDSCPPTGQLAIVFQGCRPGQPRHFFCWEEFTLARARQGFYAGQVARPGASRAGCAGRPRGCRAGLGQGI